MMASQHIPRFGVAGFERGAAFDSFEVAGMNAMVGQPEPHRLVGNKYAGRKSEATESADASVLRRMSASQCRNLLRLSVSSQDQFAPSKVECETAPGKT